MNATSPASPEEHVRATLKGYPPALVADAVRFVTSPAAGTLEPLMIGLLHHHLPAVPSERPDPRQLTGSTRLVEDLHIDSLTLAEINFLLEDLLRIRLADEDLKGLKTIDDLRAILHRHLGLTGSA